MPLYTYTSEDGDQVELMMPPGHDSVVVDGVEFKRDPVQGFALAGTCSLPTMEDGVKAGYYRQELKGGPWRSGFSKGQIKRAWGF